MGFTETVLEKDVLPDKVIRAAITARVAKRLRQARAGTPEERAERTRQVLEDRAAGPVTDHVAEANEQHYEVPTELYRLMLGPRFKYSSCWYPSGIDGLAAAEDAMLELTLARAEIGGGQRILELGCGWGSVSLFMAERNSTSDITAVSNSATQREYIEKQVADRGLTNLRVITCDVAELEPEGTFDRVISVEMFEHVANHRELLRRISTWLEPDGKLFVHVFSHRDAWWLFDHTDPSDWMGQYFFTGGIMPSDDLLLHEQRDLAVTGHWIMGGEHYARTLDDWLERLDENRERVLELFAETYGGPAEAEKWLVRWRTFCMACSGLFGYKGGTEFGVSHYLFERRPA